MHIIYRKKKFEEWYLNQVKGKKHFGDKLYAKYVQAVEDMKACVCLDDLKALKQYRFHPLTNNLKGKYSISLTGRVRIVLLIVEIDDEEGLKIYEVDKEHYESTR